MIKTMFVAKNAYIVLAGLYILSLIIVNGIAPMLASAAQTTEKSIRMSSAATSAASQTYEVNFTTATTSTIQSVVVDFCSESPVVGAACTKPTGMTVGTTVATPTGLSGTWTGATTQSGKTLVISNATGGSVSSGVAVSIAVSGFTNPSTLGTFYARILTFTTTAGGNGYTSTSPGTYVDHGGVALSTTETIGITATVPESLTFCVSASAPGSGCTSTTAPNITLGHGSPPILDTSAVDTAPVYFQLSTNAANATSVRMKGGGDLTAGSNTIPAAGAAAIAFTPGMANGRFGARVANGTGGTGTVSMAAPYNSGSNYAMDKTTANNNVSSTYGNIISTASGPVANVNSTMTFAATAGPTTAAGIYTTSFSLIATSSY